MYAADGRAWLGGGATVPEFRNRGAQKALITARLNQGISQSVSDIRRRNGPAFCRGAKYLSRQSHRGRIRADLC